MIILLYRTKSPNDHLVASPALIGHRFGIVGKVGIVGIVGIVGWRIDGRGDGGIGFAWRARQQDDG